MTVSNIHRQSGPDVRGICLAVSAGLLMLLLAMWILEWFVSPTTLALPISAIIVLALVPNLAVAAWPGSAPVAALGASFVADIVGLSAAVHYGGGADQVSAPLLYTIVIGLAGLLVSGRAAFFAAGCSALCYALVVWAEYTHVLPHLVTYQRPPDRQAATVMIVSLNLFLFAWLVSYVVGQIHASYHRAEEVREEAVSALSHDLKSPLGIISGYAQMIDEAPPAERADYVRRIRYSAQEGLDLVSNVLDAAAADSVPMQARKLPLRLNEMVEQVCDLHRFTAEGKHIRLCTTLAPQLPVIDADAQLINRALGNLLSNAIKYTERGGTVQVSTAAAEDAVLLMVSDSGCGIAAAEQGRLFQKYSRATTSRTTEGTGLGLFIVRRIAEAHGGSVSVSSDVGKGSTFTVRLPRN